MIADGRIVSKLIEEVDLLARHILMLKVTKENQPIGIVRLSEILDIPTHRVRYSLRLLERDGLVIPTQEGARVTDDYERHMGELTELLKSLIVRIEGLLDETTQAAKEPSGPT